MEMLQIVQGWEQIDHVTTTFFLPLGFVVHLSEMEGGKN